MRHRCVRPTTRRRTSLARSSTRTCLEAAGKDILSGAKSSLRFCSPEENRRRIDRRAGWARAWKTRSRLGERSRTIWFSIPAGPATVNHSVYYLAKPAPVTGSRRVRRTGPWRPCCQLSSEAFRRASASSHWWEMRSSDSRALWTAPGSSRNRFSRPCRTLRTNPAPRRIRRCLVIDWRVTPWPSVRRAIDRGEPRPSFATRDIRVSSPSAAKMRASRRRAAASDLDGLAGIGLDVPELLLPAAGVHAERLGAAGCGDGVKARLGDLKQSSGSGLLEAELDKSAVFLGIVDGGIDRVRVPIEREVPFGVDLVHEYFHHDVLVARIGDLAAGELPGDKRRFEVDAEPLTKLLVVGQGLPDAGDRSEERRVG